MTHSPLYRSLALLLVLGGAAAGFACSSQGAAPSDSQSADITGGSPSANDAVVLVADEDDHYLGSGALVAADTVALSDLFAARAVSVYVGFSKVVDPQLPLQGQAGSAVRLSVKLADAPSGLAGCGEPGVALVRLVAPAAGVTPLARASAAPAVGTLCSVVGHGEDGQGGGVGEQRAATMQVTSTTGCELDAKGVTGSIAVGQWDGMLLCNGKLAGIKKLTIFPSPPLSPSPSQVDNSVSFTSLGDPNMADAFDKALKNVTADAGAAVDAGPAPVPGTPCPTVDEIAHKTCGNCGTSATLCLAAGAGATQLWSAYGVCEQEGCTPGSVETTQAGCADPSQHRKRTCGSQCAWTLYGVCQ